MSPREKQLDILDVLRQVVEIRKQIIMESELLAISERLVPFHGIELFRILRAIPGDNYFPSGFEIEGRVRKALGLEPLKSISDGVKGPTAKQRFAEILKVVNKEEHDPLGELEDFGKFEENPLAAIESFD